MGKRAVLGAMILLLGFIYPTHAGVILADFEPDSLQNVQSTPSTALFSQILIKPFSSKFLKVTITAYSSTPEETDDTPFITASGKKVRDGIVATNFLPFGTKVQIPSLFGSKVFVVEDRMHPRMTNRLDVWMSSKADAKQFGLQRAEIVILSS